MKKKTIVFLIILTMIISIIPISIYGYSGIDTDVEIGKNQNIINSSSAITNKIVGAIQVVGSSVSVIALVIIGIRYMLSSVEEKASMKGVISYYLIGAILVFATTNILSIVYKIIINIKT